MKKTILLLFALFALCAVRAERISESDARQLAREFLQRQPGLVPHGAQSLRLAHTATAYYAYDCAPSGGFVLVAADDRADKSILGYTDNGRFDLGQLPPALVWLLSEYDRELAQLDARPSDAPARVQEASPTYPAVAPLIKSQWSQGEPYNLLCPLDDNGERCVTGCVATALAQIMYYYRYPATSTDGEAFDWDAMTDTYNEASSEASRLAVAKLMSDVGVAVGMQYGASFSGAYSQEALPALISDFGYDRGVQAYSRSYYSRNEWKTLLYTELAAGRPVYYDGANSGGGHAFICDGYQDDYFHINWGWGGYSNGYYCLTGAVSDVGSYNSSQDIYVGIQPPAGGQPQAGSMGNPTNFALNVTEYPAVYNRTDYVTFTGQFTNTALWPLDLTLGVKLKDASGDSLYAASSAGLSDFGCGWYFDSYSMTLADFPTQDGTYVVTPAFRESGSGVWYDMQTPVDASSYYLLATVEGDQITFNLPSLQSALNFDDFQLDYEPYPGDFLTGQVTVSQSGVPFQRVLQAVVTERDGYTVLTASPTFLLELQAGESVTVPFGQANDFQAPLSPGEYDLIFIADNTIISPRFPFTVTEAPAGELALRVASPLSVANADQVIADKFSLSAEVACDGGFYSGNLYALVFPIEGGYNVSTLLIPVRIESGQTTTVNYSGAIEGVEAGMSYQVLLYYLVGNTLYPLSGDDMNRATFTVGAVTGLGDTPVTDAPRTFEVYDLSGTRVLRQTGTSPNLSSLPAGVYIVRDGQTVRKVLRP